MCKCTALLLKSLQALLMQMIPAGKSQAQILKLTYTRFDNGSIHTHVRTYTQPFHPILVP